MCYHHRRKWRIHAREGTGGTRPPEFDQEGTPMYNLSLPQISLNDSRVHIPLGRYIDR